MEAKCGSVEKESLTQFLVYECQLLHWLAKCPLPVDDREDCLITAYAKLVGRDFPNASAADLREIVFATLRKTLLDEIARRHVSDSQAISRAIPEIPEPANDPDASFNDNFLLSLHIQAIQRLPSRCRQVFTLRKVYSYTQAEIAVRLNMNPKDVEDALVVSARACARAEQTIGSRPWRLSRMLLKCMRRLLRRFS
jgi:RNA polymerase sigma-70 factor (ECF subfamily)